MSTEALYEANRGGREGGREGRTTLMRGQMMRLVRGKTAKMRPMTVLLVPVRALASCESEGQMGGERGREVICVRI